MTESRLQTAQGLLCPACKVTLVMSDRQGIEIDYCPQCRGVWLDRGELDKIIERSAGQAAPQAMPAPPPARGSRDSDYREQGEHGEQGEYGERGGHGRQGYRRKSWLSEIFD